MTIDPKKPIDHLENLEHITSQPTAQNDNQPLDSAIPQETLANVPKNGLLLNEIISDDTLIWQVHNCKITKKLASQTEPMPFLYHYDTLSDELKMAYPLTPSLLAKFNQPMLPAEANALLALPEQTIPTPWQVKIIGTLVIFCEPLQVALRLKFTNTAKNAQAIYTSDKQTAWLHAIKDWHLYSDVFILNKHSTALFVLVDDALMAIEPSDAYQCLAPAQTLAVQALLEQQDNLKNMLSAAIKQRFE
ncbi:hypothetical protein [Psychrobacter sp. I-STPA6b]|uniref:hypothetical protein n=1 Tax=Psychrobacter sp. I-STPA6b TaxID=2585718 RepID=UPI001D0C2EE8|nr:hypothetical protein [Psychrobacter sp. I-STPA6b]